MKRKLWQDLFVWRESKERKPLLLQGVRQCGKTWLLRTFAEEAYQNQVYVSLDINQRIAAYFEESIEPRTIVRMLAAETGQPINPGTTLIILDEIQASERALASLKYFAELAPEYHIVAAGSLLGVALDRQEFSFPVGKVHSMTLYPLDFEEFLWASDEDFLAGQIKEHYMSMKPLNQGLHLKALELWRRYLVCGGMPAVVSATAQDGDLSQAPFIAAGINNGYLADMAKYASPSEAVKARECYDSMVAQLGKENHKFQYSVVKRGATGPRYDAAIEWLDMAGITLRCSKVNQGLQPLSSSLDASSFKLYLGDVGLLCAKSEVRVGDILSGGAYHFKGALTENYVAQQLKASGHALFYWTSAGTAEVDFLIQGQQGVSAIEVKSSENTRSKSLTSFVKRYAPWRAIRLSTKPFGDAGGILSVPLYAAFCI
ncbi:MAG: ATP-binding protein [Coriobacteriales bacterium]|jgi:predicted AAA+ superfamily ATPase|nr:ATP-binding protein [Coriobacteriales bacterium]